MFSNQSIFHVPRPPPPFPLAAALSAVSEVRRLNSLVSNAARGHTPCGHCWDFWHAVRRVLPMPRVEREAHEFLQQSRMFLDVVLVKRNGVELPPRVVFRGFQ